MAVALETILVSCGRGLVARGWSGWSSPSDCDVSCVKEGHHGEFRE